FRTALITWLGASDNGLSRVRADELCAGNTCVTEAQLQRLLGTGGGGIGGTPSVDQSTSSTEDASSTPPIDTPLVDASSTTP
ncbi:MAG: hypothetical protein JWO50_864, partial [Candidatus Kaiserbacteria bacterium]|nr:hypothetical protein [Candidatus Kaiserbacteria bacterium]